MDFKHPLWISRDNAVDLVQITFLKPLVLYDSNRKKQLSEKSYVLTKKLKNQLTNDVATSVLSGSKE